MLDHTTLLQRVRYSKRTGEFVYLTHRWSNLIGAKAGSVMSHGYIEISISGERFTAHRLAWFYVTGAWPKCHLDHKDGDRSNNKWANLREATVSQNLSNKVIQRNNKCGVRGVVYDEARGLWRAYCNKDGIHYHLGRHATLADAEAARKIGSKRIHGEFSPEHRHA